MSEREAFRLTLLRNERAMNRERREFADAVMAAMQSMQRLSGERFDQFAYMRTMRALDPIFDAWYGQWPGDRRARFWQLIVGQCRDAWVERFQAAVRDVRQRMRTSPDLIRAIRDAA